MREILFKGKRIDNGEWVEGYYLRDQYHMEPKCTMHQKKFMNTFCAAFAQ